MNRVEQERYRVALESLAEEIRRRLEGDEEAAQPVPPDRAIGRLTRVEAMQAQQMTLAMRRRRQERLQRIGHALELIRQERYGVCSRCGEDIGAARLDASPDTFLCLPCMERLPRR